MSSADRLSFRALLLLSAVGLAGMGALATMPGWIGGFGGSGWVGFLGRFHPVVLHLPIGIVSLAALLEVAHCADRSKAPHGAGLLVLGTGAVSAVVAVVTGILLHRSGGNYAPELVARHQSLGIVFACGMVVVLLAKAWSQVLGRIGWLYRTLLFVNVAVMAVAGHDGGSLTHGPGFLFDSAPATLRKLLKLPAKPGSEANQPIEDWPVYGRIVAPILEHRCGSCHNEAKTKGNLRMDTHAFLLQGGKEGPAVVAGKVERSGLIVRAEFPEDDEERMPPDGKPGFAAAELVVLKWWIAQGASSEKSVSDLNPAAEVMTAIREVAAAR